MYNLPNLFTLANLLCGCLAIHAVFHEDQKFLLIFFGLSLLFDLLDGLVARALNQSSPIGAQLDSLADMVSFGVLPGVLLFHLIELQSGIDGIFPAALGFVFTAAAALRLAKFNIDDRQTKDFMGLNTPAATIAVVGLYINSSFSNCSEFAVLGSSNLVMIMISGLLLSVLLLVDLPMMSFKFDSKDKKRLTNHAILIGVGIIILLLMQTCALPFLILWYILFSIIRFVIQKIRS